MNIKRYFQLGLLLLCGWWSLAQAVTVKNLAASQVPVADRSAKVQQQATQQAIDQVLVRISGNPSVMSVPAIRDAIAKHLSDYIQSYAYNKGTDAQQGSQLYLQVQFDQAALMNLLKQSGQAIWGADRPQVLVWINLSQNGDEQYLSATKNNALSQAVNQIAQQRGIPLLWPLMDLQDQDQWQNSASGQMVTPAVLNYLQQRYGVGDVLAAQVVQKNNQWQVNWLLMLNGEPLKWQTENADEAQAFVQGINLAANTMAAQLAVLQGHGMQAQIILQINGIQGLGDYVEVMKYLRQLNPVSHVTLQDLNANSMVVEVTSAGGENKLVQAISADHRLQQLPAPAGNNHKLANVDLRYDWQTNNAAGVTP